MFSSFWQLMRCIRLDVNYSAKVGYEQMTISVYGG